MAITVVDFMQPWTAVVGLAPFTIPKDDVRLQQGTDAQRFQRKEDFVLRIAFHRFEIELRNAILELWFWGN